MKLLNRIAMLTPAMIQAEMQTSIPLPAWQTHKTDLDKLYTQRIAEISKHGYGIYARHHMFTVGASGELVPVQYPDPISLEQMVGYERERGIVVENTKHSLQENTPPTSSSPEMPARENLQLSSNCQRVQRRRTAADRTEQRPTVLHSPDHGSPVQKSAEVYPLY